MGVEIKKVFRQDIFGVDALDTDPGHGTVEICVLSYTQISQEIKAKFLRELGLRLHEAYCWAAEQLGIYDSDNRNPADEAEAEITPMDCEEIKAALALKYGTVQAVSSVTHYLEGIKEAAEAMGITKDELIEAAKAIRKDDAI